MDALGIMGGIGAGVSQGMEALDAQKSKDQERAIKDFQIRDLAEKEAKKNRMIPVSAFWPTYKEFPESMKYLEKAFYSTGKGSGFVGGQVPMVKQGDLEDILKLMSVKKEIGMGLIEANKQDLMTQHMSLTKIVEGGVDEEGKKYPTNVIEEAKKKLPSITKQIASVETMQNYSKLMIEEIKANKEKDIKQYGQLPDGTKLFMKGNKVVDASGKEYSAGEIQSATPQSEMTRAVPTTSTVIRVGGEGAPKDTRSSEEKAFERAKKEGFKGGFMDFLKVYKNLKEPANTGFPFTRPKVSK